MKELEYPFDPDYLLKNRKRIKRMLLNSTEDRLKVRIAVLGGSTTDSIVKQLDIFLLNMGIEAEFYQSEYDKYYEDALFSNEILDSFKPDIVYVYTTNRNISRYPSMFDSAADIHHMVEEECSKLKQIWENIQARFNCSIIQNNFEYPFFRLLGNMDASDVHGSVNFISKLNYEIYKNITEIKGVYLCDLNYIAADYGLKNWHNVMHWSMYKYALDISAIPYLAFNIANIVKAIYGKNKKGFVLDLDNTLWGGIAGDDGIENLKIGKEESIGQAFYEFQDYIKKHKDMGIVLTVASKNDDEVARQGLRNPECILHEDDFVIIKANWEPKDISFSEIAHELNVLPDSLVFIDDNPAEREIITSRFEGVSAPDIGNVQDYIVRIDRSGFFEPIRISSDDLRRNEMYRENINRERLISQFTDYRDYLLNLKMYADIKTFDDLSIPRVAQLINKTNQFNLTTKRYTQEEVKHFADDSSYICLCGKLYDKFGDNGIVSVVIGRIENSQCFIDLWLMSCRVLKRNFEKAMMDELYKECESRGIKDVVGFYYPTAKNGMVKDLYGSFGFEKILENKDGSSQWLLHIEDYKLLNDVIQINIKEI